MSNNTCCGTNTRKRQFYSRDPWPSLFASPFFGGFPEQLLMRAPTSGIAARTASSGRAPQGFPAVNVWESEETFTVEAELPGLSMKDLELTLMGSELTIKGDLKDHLVAPAGGVDDVHRLLIHRRERGVGNFARTVKFPVEIDADHVSASLKNGVLSMILPKAAAAKPRRIQINS